MASTTLEIPVPVRDRLRNHKEHPRQAYHEVITQALDALDARGAQGKDGVLEKHRNALRNLARKHGLQVRIIGSRAGGDAKASDDLDIIVRLDKERSLFDLASFVAEAEATLPVPLDLRMHAALPEVIRKSMMKQAVQL